jgi:hypothetical protein
MASRESLRLAGALLLPLTLTTAALAASCSNSDNPQPQVPVYTTDSGADTSVQSDTGSGGDTGPSGDDGGPTPDASADAPSHDVQLDVDAAACTTDAGCWSCPPTTEGQFLNQCTSSTCSPFANTTRVPGYDGGALPPLP